MTLLKNLKSVSKATVAIMLLGTVAMANAEANRDLFQMTKVESTESAITKKMSVTVSDNIIISAPTIAELGGAVSISVRAKGFKNVQSIAILAEKNTNPMLASFKMSSGTNPFIKSRVKLRMTTRVIALVKADGKFYKAYRLVKITKGGC